MCITLMCLLIGVKLTKEKSQSQVIAGMGVSKIPEIHTKSAKLGKGCGLQKLG